MKVLFSISTRSRKAHTSRRMQILSLLRVLHMLSAWLLEWLSKTIKEVVPYLPASGGRQYNGIDRSGTSGERKRPGGKPKNTSPAKRGDNDNGPSRVKTGLLECINFHTVPESSHLRMWRQAIAWDECRVGHNAEALFLKARREFKLSLERRLSS